MNIIPRSLCIILLFSIISPKVYSSEPKRPKDQAPKFLFILHSNRANYMSEDGATTILQFPKERISAVEMFSNRFHNIRSKFIQPSVRDLWKPRDLNFKKSENNP